MEGYLIKTIKQECYSECVLLENIHSSSQKVKGNSKGVGEGGGGWHLKTQNFKGKYEAKKEFPEEWEDLNWSKASVGRIFSVTCII